MMESTSRMGFFVAHEDLQRRQPMSQTVEWIFCLWTLSKTAWQFDKNIWDLKLAGNNPIPSNIW